MTDEQVTVDWSRSCQKGSEGRMEGPGKGVAQRGVVGIEAPDWSLVFTTARWKYVLGLTYLGSASEASQCTD